MGDEPVGERDAEPDPDERDAKNITLKHRTWDALAEAYPHALDETEQIRQAIHDAIERDADESE